MVKEFAMPQTRVLRFALAMLISSCFTTAQAIAEQQPRNVRDSRQFEDGEYRLIKEEVSAIHGRIAFYTKVEEQPKLRRLRVEYSKKGASKKDVHLSKAIELRHGEHTSEFSIESFIDERTGLWCLYDISGEDFVMLVGLPDKNRRPKYDFWHPGVRVGWGRGLWVKYFREIREVHNELPYESLPSELQIANGR